MEHIELCYDASPDLEWISTGEHEKFVEAYKKLQQLDSLSVKTHLHKWRFSSELVFNIGGRKESLEAGLRSLYNECGIPAAIAKSRFGTYGSNSSRKAVEISEDVIREIDPECPIKNLYVSSCLSRQPKK